MSAEDHTSVQEWLEHARKDAGAAKALTASGYPLQGLFFVQQSIEKALKGMLAAKGMPYSKIKKFGHENLDSFLALNRELLEDGFALGSIERLVDSSLFEKLERMERLAADRRRGRGRKRDPEADRLRAEVATFSPSEVALLLTTLERIENVLVATTRQPIKLGSPPPTGSLFNWMWDQIMKQVYSRIPRSRWPKGTDDHIGVAKDLLRSFFHLFGESRIRAGLSETNEWSIGLHFQWVLTYITVYITGAIVWPHAVSARYPARGGQDDAFETARRGNMGTRHYTDQIGARAHLEALASRAEQTTRTLIKCHQEGIGIFPNPDNAAA